MRIDAQAKQVALSVGELAGFRNSPTDRQRESGRWRAEVGQKWHQAAQIRAADEFPGARFEERFSVRWLHSGWQFDIQGRIDQLLPTPGGYLVREVKTVRNALPADQADLAERYPDYFAQAASYLCLLRKHPEWRLHELRAELMFIEIETGAVQRVPLTEGDEGRFLSQLERLLPYLEDRRNCRLRFVEAAINPAFPQLREGQQDAFDALAVSSIRAQSVLFEAPTGFGKTGTILEHVLRRMQEGHFDRCIYLTSKSTGQLETVRQLQAMTGGHLRYIQMRNREEHRIDHAKHRCTGDRRCDEGLETRWAEAGIDAASLFENGSVPLEVVKTIGASTGLCPYALTRACLPYADFWVGDYNYIFGPDSRHLFLDAPGFEANRTCLIVDEAHNLPARAADALSLTLREYELTLAAEALRDAGGARRTVNLYLALATQIRNAPSGQRLDEATVYTLVDLCEEISRQLEQTPLPFGELLPSLQELLWSIPRLLRSLNGPADAWLFWIDGVGELQATCLQASAWIQACLSPFGSVCLMSATLEPVDSFRADCGLDPAQSPLVCGEAAWRGNAYDVAIDTRVDTRLKLRSQHYETTAATIIAAIEHSPGRPVAVFFSSYQYAENVREYLITLRPDLRSQVQPRGGDLSERETFIAEGLLCADALFLILGSSFSEGIDQLGGQIGIAIVVGPALPEMNLVQEARRQLSDAATPQEAFQKTCIEPAMCRIHQALGRLIRAPGQSAKILLHGKRFTEADYFERLRPEFQTERCIRNSTDLLDWLGNGR